MRAECRDLLNRPHMRTEPRFHRRSNAQGLMHATEVVVHMKQREHSDVIIELLAEGVRQPSEPPHIHPHVEILPFDIGQSRCAPGPGRR